MTFPQGGNCMSRDLKYIGMDVYKEAIVIAVLNCTLGLRSFSTDRRRAPQLHETIKWGRSNGDWHRH
jgi:hypothetical protein